MESNGHQTALIKYDAMCQAIALAYDVDGVKGIRDKAVALEMYFRQARNRNAKPVRFGCGLSAGPGHC